MLLHVDIYNLKSHFGKRLCKNGGGNDFFSIYFILIKLCGIFQKCTNCLSELQMPFSQNDAISDFIYF